MIDDFFQNFMVFLLADAAFVSAGRDAGGTWKSFEGNLELSKLQARDLPAAVFEIGPATSEPDFVMNDLQNVLVRLEMGVFWRQSKNDDANRQTRVLMDALFGAAMRGGSFTNTAMQVTVLGTERIVAENDPSLRGLRASISAEIEVVA